MSTLAAPVVAVVAVESADLACTVVVVVATAAAACIAADPCYVLYCLLCYPRHQQLLSMTEAGVTATYPLLLLWGYTNDHVSADW